MHAVPDDTPRTTPEVPIVAMPVAELDQLPPAGVADNVVVAPTQTVNVPVMGVGAGRIVTVNALDKVPFSGQLSSLNVR